MTNLVDNPLNVRLLSKNIFVLIILLLASHRFTFSQVTFQKTYSEMPIYYHSTNWVHQTSDGGFILITCVFKDSLMQNDWLLIKTDLSGDTLWTKKIGGTSDDITLDIQQTTDGGFIIAGAKASVENGHYDFALAKTDSTGDISWYKVMNLPDSTTDGIREASIVQCFDGGYMISASNFLTVNPYRNGLLIKTDLNGDTLWTRNFNGTSLPSVRQTADSGYVVAGNSNSAPFLFKLNQAGAFIWIKSYSLTSSSYIRAVSTTSDSGFIIAGMVNQASGTYSYLIKTDSAGDTLWARTYDTHLGTIVSSHFNWAEETTDGGYIACGADAVVKTDSLGSPVWARHYSAFNFTSQLLCIRLTNDGGYIISGIEMYYSPYVDKFYVIKTDNNGISGCHNSVFTAQVTGVTMTSVGGGGMSFYSPIAITSPPIPVSSGDSIVDINILCLSTGIESVLSPYNKLIVHPNPASDKFTIKFPSFVNRNCILFIKYFLILLSNPDSAYQSFG